MFRRRLAGERGAAVHDHRRIVRGQHDDERIGQLGVDDAHLGKRRRDRVVVGLGVLQRRERARLLESETDPPRLDHQKIAVRVFLEHVDRARRHHGQGRLQGACALEIEMQPRATEEAEQFRRRGRYGGEFGRRGDDRIVLRPHFRDQVARIDATRSARVAAGQEVLHAAAEHDVHASAELAVVARTADDELRGDRVLAIAMAQVRIGRGGGGLGDARRRDDAGAAARRLRQFEQRRHGAAVARCRTRRLGAFRVRRAVRILSARFGGRCDDGVVDLDAGHVGRHRGRCIACVRVVRPGLDESRLGKLVDREFAVFAGRVDARGRHRHHAIAIADEDDQIACRVRHRRSDLGRRRLRAEHHRHVPALEDDRGPDRDSGNQRRDDQE